jgi:hypothetical protein
MTCSAGKSVRPAARSFRVRASAEEEPAAAPVAEEPTPVVTKAPTAWSLMEFQQAPELINARCSMVAFVAAAAAEASTDKPVLTQLACEPVPILLFVGLMAAATFAPMLKSAGEKSNGSFTSSAELLNGRAAMIGFASLLITEGISGKAFF